MKVIELLNKIANGEEVPNKVKFFSTIYELEEDNDYHSGDDNEYYDDNLLFSGVENAKEFLNDEVEVIEEDKKIEKLEIEPLNIKDDLQRQIEFVHYENVMIGNKINEIIDKINEGE